METSLGVGPEPPPQLALARCDCEPTPPCLTREGIRRASSPSATSATCRTFRSLSRALRDEGACGSEGMPWAPEDALSLFLSLPAFFVSSPVMSLTSYLPSNLCRRLARNAHELASGGGVEFVPEASLDADG